MEMSNEKTLDKKEKKFDKKEQYEIILKLYQGLDNNLQKISQKVKVNKDDNSITQLAFKSDKITSALQSCLDFDNKEAVKISENLRDIYRHIRLALKLIYENQNFELLKSATDVTFTLKDSWAKIRSSI